MSKALCALALVLLLTTARLSAHHAFTAEYDENRRVTVSGTVTTFKWINPHVWVYLDSKDEHGKIAKWRFELGSPGGLTARGWKRTDLKAGDAVTLEGFGAKNGKNVKAMGDASSAVLTIMCSIGDRLGLFKDLAAQGPATSSELAVRTGIDERYAREWLGAMASAGYVMYEGFCKPGRLQ